MNDEETKTILKGILKWQKLQGIKILRETLPSILDTDEKRIVYENTDGKKTARDIMKIVNVGLGTLSRWWNDWYSQGVLEKKGQKYVKIASLKELGINSTVKEKGSK